MELDHMFLFVKDEATARSMMKAAGLRVNYSRAHPGQGTKNLCACLDDIYFELLWMDGTEVSDETERVGLGRRGRGNGSPFGIAWRGDADIDVVFYAAPFLPEGLDIPIAKASMDPELPFVFQSPGGSRPIDRDDELTGKRQRPFLASLEHCSIRLPDPDILPRFMHEFERLSFERGAPRIEVLLTAPDRQATHRFTWSVL